MVGTWRKYKTTIVAVMVGLTSFAAGVVLANRVAVLNIPGLAGNRVLVPDPSLDIAKVNWVLSQPGGGILFALTTNNLAADPTQCSFIVPSCASAIEIVDLRTMARVQTLPLGQVVGTSLAVSPATQRLYVVDRLNSAVAVFDALTGARVATVPVADPRDSVLSADGKRLYVSAGQSIVAIETLTNTVLRILTTGNDTTLGIALSLDGGTLGAVSTSGGLNPALYLVDASTLTLRARVAITNPGEPTNCATFPNDVAFTVGGRALLWDSNCDNFYQVDVATATQLTAGTVRMGRDAASSSNFNNIIQYSAASGKGYALKESNELAIMTPSPPSGSLVGGFSGTPFVPALTPDARQLLTSVIHRFSGGGADTLDMYDTLGNTFTRNVYTFSNSTMSVRDMRIISSVGSPTSTVTGLELLVFPNATTLELRLYQINVQVSCLTAQGIEFICSSGGASLVLPSRDAGLRPVPIALVPVLNPEVVEVHDLSFIVSSTTQVGLQGPSLFAGTSSTTFRVEAGKTTLMPLTLRGFGGVPAKTTGSIMLQKIPSGFHASIGDCDPTTVPCPYTLDASKVGPSGTVETIVTVTLTADPTGLGGIVGPECISATASFVGPNDVTINLADLSVFFIQKELVP